MTWLWRICFSAGTLWVFTAVPLPAASVAGRVMLRDSKDPAVKKHADYSGVVVSLKPAEGVIPARTAASRAKMLQKNKTFSPHVLPILVGTTVDFPNADPIFHNAFSSYNGQIFDVGLYPPGSSQSVRFTRPGVVRVFCNIHSSMSAVIVVLATPYFAVSGRDGAFAIPDVPPGDYDLEVFHERASESTLRQLRRRVSVSDQNLSLPVIDISEAGFLSIPHKNKFGHDYRPEPDERSIYPAARN